MRRNVFGIGLDRPLHFRSFPKYRRRRYARIFLASEPFLPKRGAFRVFDSRRVVKNIPVPVVRRTRPAFLVFVFPSRNQNRAEQRERNAVAFRSFRRFRRFVRVCRELEKRSRMALRFFRRPVSGRNGRRFGRRGRAARRIGSGSRNFGRNPAGISGRNFFRDSGRLRGVNSGNRSRGAFRRISSVTRSSES